MFVLPLLLVTVASTYTSDYHEITTTLWSQIPDTLPTGNTVPKGCSCELPANPCLNFDCGCLCDLTAGACDANCCCDTECSQEEINIFRDSDSCADETTATGTTTQCLSNDDLYDTNPKYSMNVENFIEKSMLCIVVDNSPSDGSFYKDPGTLTAQTFCDSDISPEYAFTNNGRTCSGSSERYTFSSLNNKFRAGEAIPLAHADNVGSLSLSMGGFLSIPVAGQSGSCNDFNPAGYMNSVSSSSCNRRAVTSTGTCATDVYRNLDLENARIGTSPESLGLLLAQNYVSINVTSYCLYNITSQSEYSCVSSSSYPQTADAGSGQGCSNVLRDLSLDVLTDGRGGIQSVSASLVLYDQVDASSSNEDVFVTQSYSLSFTNSNSSALANRTFELGNLIPRSKSGNAGYLFGHAVNVGHEETLSTSSNITKRAVRMLTDGLHVPAPLATGGFDSNNVIISTFGNDLKSGCVVSLMEHELESACEAFATSSTLPVSLSDFWTTVLNGTIKTMFGKYGNSDPLNFDDWIEPESETLSTFAQAALYNSQDRQCENMVTSLNLDIMYANTGEEGNPQPKIVSSRLWFGFDTWRYRDTSRVNVTQNFGFYTTVNFVNYDSKVTGAVVPPTPDLLPTLPHDLWYPFTLSSASKSGPSSLFLVVLTAVSTLVLSLNRE